ncbi:MAG: hypothetical protein Q8N23_15455 [Archangium sp.]|nr:hypothetical protein [Archangium sp.]MDP3154070.1 hypothetical protein [Archangium sp.]MDP3570026.1 hypothetical protein [Archangium sp.]
MGQRPLTFKEPEFFQGETSSAPDLAMQAAQENAQRQRDLKSLSILDAPIAALGARFDADTSFKLKHVTAFGKAIQTPEFMSAAANLSPADVRARVEEQVKKAWPQASPEQTQQLKQYLMKEMGEFLRQGAAPRMQETATRMLDAAAKSFDKTAANPSETAALATRLTEMAHPLAPVEDQCEVRDLRIALGLKADQANVSPEDLTKGLKARAALLHQEAKKMKYHDQLTVFRALAEQDVSGIYKQAKGIREGSMLAAQIDGVRQKGENENTAIAGAQLSAMVAAAVVTGGLGVGGFAGVAISSGAALSLKAPSVLSAWQSVDTAKAGESAGTMKAGAEDEATQKAVIVTAEAVAGAGASALGSHQLHGATEALAKPMVEHMADNLVRGAAHGVIEGLVEKGGGKIAHWAEHKLANEGQATGKNALERAKP